MHSVGQAFLPVRFDARNGACYASAILLADRQKWLSHKLFAGYGGLVRLVVARDCACVGACLRFGGGFLGGLGNSLFGDAAICRGAVWRVEYAFVAGLAEGDAFVGAERFAGKGLEFF